jgi:hypothetical protein
MHSRAQPYHAQIRSLFRYASFVVSLYNRATGEKSECDMLGIRHPTLLNGFHL